MESGAMMQPVIQYGFAGFAAVQLVLIFWLVSKIMTAFERNTIAYQRLISMLQTRPCLNGDRIFVSRDE